MERVWGGSGSSSRGGRGSGCGLAPQHGVGEVLFKMEADEDVTQQRYHLSQRARAERHPATCSDTHMQHDSIAIHTHNTITMYMHMYDCV